MKTITILDLESVLIPEIWIKVAEHFGIQELHATTREIPDFDKLMRHRIDVLRKNDVKLFHLENIIKNMEPLEGAAEFLNWLRGRTEVVVISGSFLQFVKPFRSKLNFGTLYCHELIIDTEGYITDYRKRERGDKKNYVREFNVKGNRTIAVGDSYNDVGMLKEADVGILFNASDKLKEEMPELKYFADYKELEDFISEKILQFNRV